MFKKLLLSLALSTTLVGSALGTSSETTSDTTPETVSEAPAENEEIREDASHVHEEFTDTEKKENTDDSAAVNRQAATTIIKPTQNAVTRTEQATTTDKAVDTTKGKLKISITPEKKGWFNEAAKVKVVVTKIKAVGNFKIDTVEAKAGASGSWQDISDEMLFEIKENCTVYVKVTDQDGNEYEKSANIKCFDIVAPTVNAAVNEGLLSIMTYDTESGVKDVYVNEYRYAPDDNGVVTIRLQKFDASYQFFYIYALDKAGNASQVYTIQNPYWTDPNAETDENEEDKPDPAESLPDNAQPQTTGESSAEVTSVTNQDGEDITEEIDTKQFYTIVTADGQQYYLVIDMTAAKREGGEENASMAGQGTNPYSNRNGTVYFLTSVSNQNLLNFTNDGEQTLPQNSVAKDNNIDDVTQTVQIEEPEEETTEEVADTEEKESKFDFSTFIIIAIVVLALIIVVVIKQYGGKRGKPEANDDEMFYDGHSEENREDEVPLSELEEQEETVDQ